MTKAELIKMLENYSDNTELMFIEERTDRDGYPFEIPTEIIKVVRKDLKPTRCEYGITRYIEVE